MRIKRFISLFLTLCLCLTAVPIPTEAAAGDGTYTWPVSTGYSITNGYSSSHLAADFNSPIGAAVYAVAGGTVVKAQDYGCQGSHLATNARCALGNACPAYQANPGSYGSYANWIIIDHGNNVYSLYAHLKTGTFSVSEGQTVQQGQQIACSGNAGKTKGNTGAHLHFELRMGSNSYNKGVDPAAHLTKTNPVPDVQNNPTGHLDSVTGGLGSVSVKGWAFDADDLGANLDIRIKVGGVQVGTIKANKERTDVNDVHGCGTNHGFEDTIYLDSSVSGTKEVEVWAVNIGGGSDSYLGTWTVEISGDQTPPVISNLAYSDVSSSGYTVTCTVTDDTAVDRVLFPTWTVLNDQDDLPDAWGVGTQSGSTYSYRVSTEDHNNESGTYVTHVYAYDTSGNCGEVGAITVQVPVKDSVSPVISEVHVYNITPDGYTVSCKATDNIGVERVQFPTWTLTDGQDDLAENWTTNTAVSGTKNGDYYTFTVSAVDHNGELADYVTDIYAYDADGNVTETRVGVLDLPAEKDTQAPVITDVQITKLSALGYTVVCTVTDDQNVNRVQMPTWSTANSQDDIQVNWGMSAKARATANGTTYTYRVNAIDHNCESGTYATDIYAYDDAGNVAKVSVGDVVGTIVLPKNLPLAAGLKDDFYAVIENNASRTVLTSSDNVVFSTNEGLDTQRWHFVRNDDDTYMIYGAADESLVLDIEFALDSVDANVQMCTENGSEAQCWYIHEYEGLYYLRPACAEKLLLDLPYASSADGVAAKINNPNSGGGEGFNLVGDIMQTYTVSYDANGGDGAPEAQTKAYGESLTLSAAVPTRSGYTFLGWASDSTASEAEYLPGDTYSADQDLNLYAVWADQFVASGWSGYTTWSLNDGGVLTFSGEGAMKNYTYKSEMPWYQYADQITYVVIEDGVTSIGDYAFYGMNLEFIEIPESVTSIGSFAFKNAEKLGCAVLPSGLTKLGESAFYGCTSLARVDIPASLWTIQPYTFKNCTSLTAVTFQEGNLQKISDGAFYGTALTELVLPDCLGILDVYAFKGCSALRSITIGSGLTELREAVFYGTAIEEIVIPEGISKIGPYVFKNCVDLVNVTMPESLKSVGEASFYACAELAAVELPDSVTTIGNYAFRKCTGLKSVTFGSGLLTVGESSFYGCTGLTELLLPEKVTEIKGYAFKGCTAVTAVTLPEELVTVGDSAFHTCTGVKTIVIPEKVAKIGEYCFSGSYNLWKITFQGDAPSIGTGAFKTMEATAYYPGDNATWTADVMKNYGGTITWKAA